MCKVCEGVSDEMYNPDCDMCAKNALDEWIVHCESFVDAGFPKSWDCTKDGISWFDLMHYESTYPALDSWDVVNGQYHNSMWCPVYRAESSLRAGHTITRELFLEYVEELKTNL